MVKIVIPVCSICKRPLSDSHQKLKVTAHMDCIFKVAYESSGKGSNSILQPNGKRIYVQGK